VWENIHRSAYWDVAHRDNTSLLGWLVLVCRRHIESLDELLTSEAHDLGEMIQRVSTALKRVTGCTKTYVMGFSEKPGFSHVHFHVVPRAPNLREEHQGAGIFECLNVGEKDRVTEADLAEIAEALRRELQ